MWSAGIGTVAGLWFALTMLSDIVIGLAVIVRRDWEAVAIVALVTICGALFGALILFPVLALSAVVACGSVGCLAG